jgi:putative addiction module component (TIGR02574 family)
LPNLQLVEDIWDSTAAQAPESVQLSEVKKAELHRRARF